jgi:dTDP-4-amino-4,6-dideoxygalactose transaminase
MSLGMKYRPSTPSIYLAMASLKRLRELNERCEKAWRWLCEEIEGTNGLRPQETLPGAVRGGYMSYVLAYTGDELGGPSREEFVKAVQEQGAPLSADRYPQINYTYGMLHQAPIFTTLDRRKLGGGCYDPTRPWPENVSRASLPVCERVARQLVSFPRLDRASEEFVRSCGQALRKVTRALVPQPHSGALAAETARACMHDRVAVTA